MGERPENNRALWQKRRSFCRVGWSRILQRPRRGLAVFPPNRFLSNSNSSQTGVFDVLFSLQLIVGDFSLSHDQQRSHFAFWCLMASPLVMSVDLRSINSDAKALLLNKYAIAINQDPRGSQGQFRKQVLPIFQKFINIKHAYHIFDLV